MCQKMYRQPNSKMPVHGSLCHSRTGTRLSCKGHLIERKEKKGLQKTRQRRNGRTGKNQKERVVARVKETHSY